MYKVASIEKIAKISPHPNADKLELLEILGWQVVAKKGEFKIGELVVYIEPDSIVEERLMYEFLRARNFRVRLVRLRGEVSQGIVFPLSAFTWTEQVDDSWIGRSVAREVGARHYEKPAPGAVTGKIKGDFPSFLPKTDEPNLRSYAHVLDELKGLECYAALKMDGTSISYYYNQDIFGACSRNFELAQDQHSETWKLAEKHSIETKLRAFGKNVAIQCEIYGPVIQANRMAVSTLNIAIFNLYLIDERRYANFEELEEFCCKYELPMVPVLWRKKFDFSLEQLIKLANETYYPSHSPAEGIVIRPCQECFSEELRGRLSVKIVSEKFLEEYGE